MENQPGFEGGVGFDDMSGANPNQNHFGLGSGHHYSANEDDDNPLEGAPAMANQASNDEGYEHAANDFWNQDFGTSNNNMAGEIPMDAQQEMRQNEYDGENYGQVVQTKPKKAKIGDLFDAPLTPEEEAKVAEIENEQRARLQRFEDKEMSEISERRDKAREELKEFYDDKNRERMARSKQNKEEEWAYINKRDEHKKSKNPWEKIIDNVEINQSKYLGTKDVTRMRQAMLARKADLKNQGNELGI